MGDPLFILPPDLDFECTNCGRCCRDPWEIRVDAASAERLMARPWPGVDAAAPFKPGSDLGYTVERRADGACVFLDGKNLCRIHAELGLRAKPQVCQQFPYLFSESPEGITVGLSHYCPGVRPASGGALARNLDELEALHGHALRVERAPEKIALDDDLPIAWTDYAALEGLILDLIRGGATGALGLAAATIAAAMAADFVRLRAAGKPEAPPGAAREFVDAWRRRGLERIGEIAARQKPAPRSGRLLLRQFLSLVDVAIEPASAPGRAARGGWAFAKELLGVGSIRCAPLGRHVAVGAVRAVALDWEGELALPLRRYAEHSVWRRRLLPILGVRVGLSLLVLHVAAMRHVARARAAASGRASAAAEDVATGVQLVEKHYAAHSSLGHAFAAGPARAVFRRIAARPRYARAVLEA